MAKETNRMYFAVSIVWLSCSVGVRAQTAPGTQTTNEAPLQEITVTGTRISAPGFSAPTPLTVVSANQLAETNPSAPIAALQQLPLLASSASPVLSTGSAGTGGSFLNLRNLGVNNTLVLLDGNRFVPTTGDGTIDVSLFPTALIKRVDIVTGGASAVYGSDAVAGVVNFILDKDFVGFRADAQGGTSQYNDDGERKFSIAYGTAFGGGKGHLLVSGEYYNSSGVYSLLDRPITAQNCTAITNASGTPKETLACGVVSSQANFTGVITGPAPFAGTTFDNNGSPVPFQYGTNVTSTTMVGGGGTDPSSTPLQVPIARSVGFARGSWDFSDKISSSLELLYGKSDYTYQLGSYDQTLGSTALTISANNAYLPPSLAAAMQADGVDSLTFNKYYADLPRSVVGNLNSTARVVAGLNGTAGTWRWNSHYEFGETRNEVISTYDQNLGNLAMAADAVVNPANGQIICASALNNSANGCVPYDVFGNAGMVPSETGTNAATEAQLNYITGTDWVKRTITENDVAVNVDGEPWLTWAGPISIASGLEWRREALESNVDPSGLAINPATGVQGPFRAGNYLASNGAYSAEEAYVETAVPLAKDVTLLKSLDFNGAVRVTRYSTSGTALTWKAGLTWSITSDIRLRGAQSRDERAPNLLELYSGAVENHGPIIDYVRGPTFVNAQALEFTAGNPNLKPEVGDTTTFGIVYSPHWATGWSTSIDGYHIRITDAIESLSSQNVVLYCSEGNQADCTFIGRDASGALVSVSADPQNVASLTTEGIDLETSYSFPLENWLPALHGVISLRGIGNYVSKYETSVLGSQTIDLAGEDDYPKWRWTAQAGYEIARWRIFVQGRYTGSGYFDKSLPATTLPPYLVPGEVLADANVSYDIPYHSGTVEVFLNVTDLFDKLPPAFAPGTNSSYDPIGRYFRAGIRVDL